MIFMLIKLFSAKYSALRHPGVARLADILHLLLYAARVMTCAVTI